MISPKKRNLRWLWLLPMLGIAIFYYGCSKDSDGLADSSEDALSALRASRANPELVTVSYDLEIATMVSADGHLSELDMLATAPSVERQKIAMSVKNNGEVTVNTLKTNPSRPISVKHFTRPDNSPEIIRTVMNNGTLSAFDGQGQLVREERVPALTLPHLPDLIKSAVGGKSDKIVSELLSCTRTNADMNAIIGMIENPPKDVKVTKIKGSVVALRMPMPNRALQAPGYEAVHMVDTKDGLFLGTRLYDKDGNCIMCLMIRYDECTITGFKQEIPQVLPSGRDGTLEIYGDIKNLAITYNKI